MELAHRYRNSPRLNAAAVALARATAAFHVDGSKRVHKLLAQDLRVWTVLFALYLHFDDGDEEADIGATYTRLLELVSGAFGGGHRVVATTLDLMKSLGFLVCERGARDQRLRLFRPTAEWLALVAHWIEDGLGALDVLEPGARRLERFRMEEDALRRFVRRLGHLSREGVDFPQMEPEFRKFFDREGGWSFLSLGFLAAADGVALPPRGEIARRVGFSKSQIALLATEATRLGYLRVAADQAFPTAALVKQFEIWASGFFALIAASADGTSLHARGCAAR